MTENQQYFEANRALWNQRTAVHKDSAFYDVKGFLEGKDVLTPIETNELLDVKGKSMLHLQCHFGLDSLNWVRKGAKVTGIDLSDAAITEAKRLSEVSKLPAEFICSNIYDIDKHLHDKFDIVFTSYGVVGWLPDLDKWAALISRYLKPGGVFYMAEFHPVVWMFDDQFSKVQYYYDNRELIVTESKGTYTDRDAPISAKEYSWNHSISEVLNALLSHGITLEFFNEHMYSPYPCFENIVQGADGFWRVKGMEGKIPMVYSLKGRK